MKKVIERIVKNKNICYFVSPHLDDAAFSAGGLISYLAERTRVVVVAVFTKAGKDKHSLSALSYIRQCGYKKDQLEKFYDDRRKEDKELFESYGVEVKHLGFLDALWREKKKLSIIEKFLSFFLNDFRYIYPTHKLHISKGRIYKEDLVNLKKVEKKLKEIVGDEKNSVIFCPIGLGKHVDHIMVREACTNAFSNVIYWEDSPYNLYHEYEDDFIIKNSLSRFLFKKNQSVRKSMFPAYKTQFGKLFNGKTDFILPPERYYIKNKVVRPER